MNPYFVAPMKSMLHEEATLDNIRAQYYNIRQEFLDRLACALVVDEERFDALLELMRYLPISAEANGATLIESDMDLLDDITSYLDQEAIHAKTHREVISRAQAIWVNAVTKFKSHAPSSPGG